ncbi:MAG: ABC transporter ATP-binding protein, partial [Candidatus Methanomethylophilus sp.]|nr:ABC transporter ATP-binding protein [Methanomethylophilus sp.]
LHLQGVTVLISTHDIDLAYTWADSVNVIRHGKKVFSGTSEEFYSNQEEVHLCGLLSPSTFNMNHEISALRGVPESPYPRNVSEFLSKFGKAGAGRVFCVSCPEGQACDIYDQAVKEAGADAKIGVYGSDTRYGLAGRKIDYYFDGIDSCFTEAVLGRDSVLFYDPIYDPLIKERAGILREFGSDIVLEELR